NAMDRKCKNREKETSDQRELRHVYCMKYKHKKGLQNSIKIKMIRDQPHEI
ncbi:10357_t:CDS:1, partial [Rhizophagus irregularis]